MRLEELISKIHKSVNNLEYSATRKYIEDNFEILKRNKYLLKGNARELFEIILNEKSANGEKISREEIRVLNAINSNAVSLNVRGIRNILKDYPTLFLKKDYIYYLNTEAKVLLECLGVKNIS